MWNTLSIKTVKPNVWVRLWSAASFHISKGILSVTSCPRKLPAQQQHILLHPAPPGSSHTHPQHFTFIESQAADSHYRVFTQGVKGWMPSTEPHMVRTVIDTVYEVSLLSQHFFFKEFSSIMRDLGSFLPMCLKIQFSVFQINSKHLINHYYPLPDSCLFLNIFPQCYKNDCHIHI